MIRLAVRRVSQRVLVALPAAVATAPLAGGLDTTWYASDPARQGGMPAFITLDASGSALFGRLECHWRPARLSLGDQKYCADACNDKQVRKAVINCGADKIRLYCMGECDMASVSVGNEYGQGQLYFTAERLRPDRRAPGPAASQ